MWRILQVHIPLVQERLGFQPGVLLEQILGVFDGASDLGGIAAVDVPGNEVQGKPSLIAGVQ